MDKSAGARKLVVGLGVTGLSCARYLASRGEPFMMTDSRAEPPGLETFLADYPSIELELGGFREHSFLASSEIIVSPGVSLKTPQIVAAKQAGIPVTGDIDIFAKNVKAPIVAVTGSNGKSTVVEILAAILDQAGKNYGLGGNLDSENSKPALDLLLDEPRDLYVLEVSSFQLETTDSLGAEVATLLNLSADHMDRYENMTEYLKAKRRIFNGCHKVVINRDEPSSFPEHGLKVPCIDFGFGRPGANSLGLLQEGDDQYLAFQFEKIVSVSELKVFGRHNVANMLAAIGLALSIDVDLNPIRSAIRQFPGLPHRCQWVGCVDGVDFYNDSKGTNVGATVAAIEGLGQHIKGHILLIAGGVGKGADFKTLVPVINRWGKQVILIGQDAMELASNLDPETQTYFADGMQDAVRVALENAVPGDAVLLSPACASFDMFDNYRHRGQCFVQSVEQLQ